MWHEGIEVTRPSPAVFVKLPGFTIGPGVMQTVVQFPTRVVSSVGRSVIDVGFRYVLDTALELRFGYCSVGAVGLDSRLTAGCKCEDQQDSKELG